ncbi:MAG: DUF86 domain-containing protein [Bryobacterales bacterium]|nr:DUF86 domain-containing protein [Bryobacterales bacterium]
MSSRKPAQRLMDIIENANAIARYTAGMDFSSFIGDRRTCDAVERCLERITEAAAKLGPFAVELMPNQPWPDIRALGNRLRHEYDDIGEEHLWRIVQIDLPALRRDCEQALATLGLG